MIVTSNSSSESSSKPVGQKKIWRRCSSVDSAQATAPSKLQGMTPIRCRTPVPSRNLIFDSSHEPFSVRGEFLNGPLHSGSFCSFHFARLEPSSSLTDISASRGCPWSIVVVMLPSPTNEPLGSTISGVSGEELEVPGSVHPALSPPGHRTSTLAPPPPNQDIQRQAGSQPHRAASAAPRLPGTNRQKTSAGRREVFLFLEAFMIDIPQVDS